MDIVFKAEDRHLVLCNLKHCFYSLIGLEYSKYLKLILVLDKESGRDNVGKHGGVFDRLEVGDNALCGRGEELCHSGGHLVKSAQIRLIFNTRSLGECDGFAERVCGKVSARASVIYNGCAGNSLRDTADAMLARVYKLLYLYYRTYLKKLAVFLIRVFVGNCDGVLGALEGLSCSLT